MKIQSLINDQINFDNGDVIYYEHVQDCCERNYADFEQIEQLAHDTEFAIPLQFEKCEEGFRFGNMPDKMFFVPCYSEQNGYYSKDLEIFYNSTKVIELELSVTE